MGELDYDYLSYIHMCGDVEYDLNHTTQNETDPSRYSGRLHTLKNAIFFITSLERA